MYNLIAQYPRQQICRDRQYSALLRWSSYILATPLPVEKPDENAAKQYIIASKIPASPDAYVSQTISGVAAVPDIQTNIRQHLNGFNDDTVEASMDLQVDAALAVVMPRFCATAVTDMELQQWYSDNGWPPEAAAGVINHPGAMRPPTMAS